MSPPGPRSVAFAHLLLPEHVLFAGTRAEGGTARGAWVPERPAVWSCFLFHVLRVLAHLSWAVRGRVGQIPRVALGESLDLHAVGVLQRGRPACAGPILPGQQHLRDRGQAADRTDRTDRTGLERTGRQTSAFEEGLPKVEAAALSWSDRKTNSRGAESCSCKAKADMSMYPSAPARRESEVRPGIGSSRQLCSAAEDGWMNRWVATRIVVTEILQVLWMSSQSLITGDGDKRTASAAGG